MVQKRNISSHLCLFLCWVLHRYWRVTQCIRVLFHFLGCQFGLGTIPQRTCHSEMFHTPNPEPFWASSSASAAMSQSVPPKIDLQIDPRSENWTHAACCLPLLRRRLFLGVLSHLKNEKSKLNRSSAEDVHAQTRLMGLP